MTFTIIIIIIIIYLSLAHDFQLCAFWFQTVASKCVLNHNLVVNHMRTWVLDHNLITNFIIIMIKS